MLADHPQSALYQRYASRDMGRIFSPRHRFTLWRRIWITLAECQRELGLPITEEHLAELRRHECDIDPERAAQLELETRHDVVAHLRHFAEQTGAAGGILHLGATSALITDNADVLIIRDALRLLEQRLAALITRLAGFARRTRDLPALAYTHLQAAQLTTVGKRACLWLQDSMTDLDELRWRLSRLRCRGAKGTTGTQASFLTLFGGDHDKVRDLDRRFAQRLGFQQSFPVTGQTYPRKQDSQVLQGLAGIAESCHKLGGDIRLLQGFGELSEAFEKSLQVGSSAMPYKRNPIQCERLCGLARRLLTDSLNGPLNAASQWLERSLDDSSNRRLVLQDSFLCADALLTLAAHIVGGLQVNEQTIAARVAEELPFMATETLLMEATLKGGDRQRLHERMRRYSIEARNSQASGRGNPLLDLITGDAEFNLEPEEVAAWLDPKRFTGRAAQQVDDFLRSVVEPVLDDITAAEVEEPRV